MDDPTATSSVAEEILAPVSTEATQGEVQADAPAAGAEPSLLDAVKAVLEPKKEEATPAAEEAQPEAKEEATEAKAEEVEPDDSKLPFHTHPRFKQLTTQRREFKARAEQAEQQLQALEPVKQDASHYQSIVGYMKSENLTSEEVNTGFQIMSAIKNDPLKALELLQPYVADLRKFAGDDLPADLAAKVDSGDVEEDAARELARLRHQSAFEQQKREQMEHTRQQDQQQRYQQDAATQIMQAVAQWEASAKSSDPDYAKKSELVTAYIRAEQATRPARSPQEAVAIAQRAYDKANTTLAATRPAPTQARPVSSSASIAGAKPEPKSALEAAKMALNGSR